MVSIEEIQAAYYMVAATGVLVAAIYYILNLRVSQRNQEISMKNQELMLKAQEQTLETRRLSLIENISNHVINEDGTKRWLDLMNYDWADYAEFNDKYGSENNPEAAAKRSAQFNYYNSIGSMLRRKSVDIEELHDMNMQSCVLFWEKFRPVVEETRRRYFGRDYCRDMEFLAVEMLKYMQVRDPSYSVPKNLEKFDSSK